MASSKNSKGKNPENVANTSSDSRAVFSRNDEMEKHFLELCLREVSSQGHKGVSLTQDSWKRLEKEFNSKWGVSYDHKKFKNRYDYLRADYGLWSKITNLSGHGFNADTNTILWPPEKWNDVIEQYPKAAKFRNNPLENVELLKAIFESTLAHGKFAWSSASANPPPNNDAPPNDDNNTDDDDQGNAQVVAEEVPQGDEGDLHGYGGDEFFEGVSINENDGSLLGGETGDNSSSKATPRPLKKKKGKKIGGASIDTQIENLIGAINKQIDKEEASKGPSLTDVVAVLKELKSMNVLSQQGYVKAKMMFCEKPDLRMAFMDEESLIEKIEFLNCSLGV